MQRPYQFSWYRLWDDSHAIRAAPDKSFLTGGLFRPSFQLRDNLSDRCRLRRFASNHLQAFCPAFSFALARSLLLRVVCDVYERHAMIGNPGAESEPIGGAAREIVRGVT